MSTRSLLRSTAIAVAMGISAGLALPVLAKSPPITVAFQANNPWTQQVGSVKQYDRTRDYKVAIEAGKTLQINLVTRNPNVFFKVKNDTQNKEVTDSFQTGAITWSTPNATAASYTIEVYVQPEVLQNGEVAKYALQIGQYGKADMHAASTKVTFADNNPWAQESGTLDAQGSTRDYTAQIAAGQMLAVNLVANSPKVHFKVADSSGQTVVDTANTNTTSTDNANTATTKWSTPVNTAANYTISVYVDPAAVPPGSRVGYALQVGQYAQRTAQPAATSTAAAPASSTPTVAPATASSTSP
ncbi:MAG TPA: hypothetical protein VFW60_10680 [Rhodanobacteraceae bacterium]|nr:hypothetical protein [Rhodanobacteraceae bacterium]